MNLLFLNNIDETMTLFGLRNRVIPITKERSKNVKIELVKTVNDVDKKGKFIQYIFNAKTAKSTYVSKIKIYKKNDKIPHAMSAETVVECNCPDFRYRWDYALHKNGSSDLLHSLNRRPIIRNPRMIPSSCKHINACFQFLKSKMSL